MHVYRAIKTLRRKIDYLNGPTKKVLSPEAESFIKAEIAAMQAAIYCMELVISYGYATVTANGPVTLEQTKGCPDNWTTEDVREMQKAILKNSKM